jgi:hypothetical protein
MAYADWQQGPAHIAERIREIQADHLSRRLPLAETIAVNLETNRFYSIPRDIPRPTLHAAILSRAADALGDVLADPGNGLRPNGPEARTIQRSIRQYGNDPQMIEMNFTTIHRSLTRQMAVGELPPSESNLLLDQALSEGAQSLRATLPEIAENRVILDQQAFKELTPDAVAVIAEAAPVLIAITEGDLSQSLAEDTTLLLDPSMRVRPPRPTLGAADRNPVLAGYAEEVRLFSRAARILILIRKTPDLIHRLDGTATVKGAKILGTLAALVTVGWSLLT